MLGQRVRRYAEATRYFGYDPVGAVRGGMGALGSGAVTWQRLDASSDPRHIDEARSECCQSVKVCRGVAHDYLASVAGQDPAAWGDRCKACMMCAEFDGVSSAASRGAMSAVMVAIPTARRQGLAATFGRPAREDSVTGALLGGEFSGHIFFGERWYGFDDGLYSAARLLEILAQFPGDADTFFDQFPQDVSTPEINVSVADEEKFAIIETLAREGDFGEGIKTTLDGIRVDYTDGWGLCRASNTTPALVLRFEGKDSAALARIRERFEKALHGVAPTLTIPATTTT